MKNSEFTAAFDGQISIVEKTITHRRESHGVYYLYQWCPIIGEYSRMDQNIFGFQSHWSKEDKTGAVRDDVPEKIVEAALEFQARGFQTPVILVATEKHSDRHFYANTTEALGCAALKLLDERWREGYYQSYSKEPIEPKNKPEDIEDEELKERCIDMWSKYVGQKRRYCENMRVEREISITLDNSDYWSAICTLLSRSGEYERVEIKQLEDATEWIKRRKGLIKDATV